MSDLFCEIAGCSLDVNRSVWVGLIECWMDEAYLARVFSGTGSLLNVKVVRDKDSNLPKSFAFLEFARHEDANALVEKSARNSGFFDSVDGRRFRISWGQRPMSSQSAGQQQETSLYVGNLDPNVKEEDLKRLFSARFAAVTGAKVVTDAASGQPKGFGFVRFSDANEAECAMMVMQGVCCGSRPMRVRPSTKSCFDASHNSRVGDQGFENYAPMAGANGGCTPAYASPQCGAPSAQVAPPPVGAGGNRGHFVYFAGLSPTTTEHDVLKDFQCFGVLYRGTAYPNTGVGVVEFRDYEGAEKAVMHLQSMRVKSYYLNGREAAHDAFHVLPPQFAAACFGAPLMPPPPTTAPPPIALGACMGMGGLQLPQPAITNMTTAQAKSQLRKAQGIEMPSIEHFQELLQDPCFVQAFEQQVAQACAGSVPGSHGVEYAPEKLPWLLMDRPELFMLPISVDRMNEDYIPAPDYPGEGGRALPSLSSAPLLPLEVGLA